MKYIKLSNGIEIPQLGMGGFDQNTDSMLDALDVGYRLIDTAAQYGNEAEIGQAINQSSVNRKDIFLSTKVWNEDIRQHRTKAAFEESLKRLDQQYVDMYLIHWPADGFVEAWNDMEDLYREDRAKCIGVCNCHRQHLNQIFHNSDIKPMVNQIESNPYFNNQELIGYCQSIGIPVEVWCPLGGSFGQILNDEVLQRIGKEYGKSPAQVVIRWHLQRGLIVIPKTSHRDRMESNMDVFDFELSDADMKAINALNRDTRAGANPDSFDF